MIAYAVCRRCRVRHALDPRRGDTALDEFLERHPGHPCIAVPMEFAERGLMEAYGLGEREWLELRDNADTKQAFGTSTALTCTLASLAQNAARESTVVDNTTNLFLDALVYLAVRPATGTPASDLQVLVYAYGSEDGTNYTDNATGTNAAVTMRSPTNLKMLGIIYTPDSGSLTYKAHPMAVAPAFGGIMPRKWGIVVHNRTNLSFTATEGDHAKTYSGVFSTTS